MSIEEAVETPSNIKLFTINNISKPFTSWCKEYGIEHTYALKRYKEGIPLEEILKGNHFKEKQF